MTQDTWEELTMSTAIWWHRNDPYFIKEINDPYLIKERHQRRKASMVWMFVPPSSYVEILMSNVMASGDGLWKVLRWGRALMNRIINAFIKETREKAPCPFCHVRTQVCNLEDGLHPVMQWLRFRTSRFWSVRNKCVLCKLPSLSNFGIATQKD